MNYPDSRAVKAPVAVLRLAVPESVAEQTEPSGWLFLVLEVHLQLFYISMILANLKQLCIEMIILNLHWIQMDVMQLFIFQF